MPLTCACSFMFVHLWSTVTRKWRTSHIKHQSFLFFREAFILCPRREQLTNLHKEKCVGDIMSTRLADHPNTFFHKSLWKKKKMSPHGCLTRRKRPWGMGTFLQGCEGSCPAHTAHSGGAGGHKLRSPLKARRSWGRRWTSRGHGSGDGPAETPSSGLHLGEPTGHPALLHSAAATGFNSVWTEYWGTFNNIRLRNKWMQAVT